MYTLRSILILLAVLVSNSFFSPGKKAPFVIGTPKLVIGIVVDQMRNDYISRYWNRFGDGGFKRMINNGFYCKNANYNYVPTYTGPGHSSIYTGATPSAHGIIANEWFAKENGNLIYCVEDSSAKAIGGGSKTNGASPRRQLTTTVGDELKLATNGRSKIFGVALKDRSSVLPVGHAGNAAFWYDDATGNFITSSWYTNELPLWLKSFNERKLPGSYLKNGWNTLYPIETYSASLPDDNKYESAPNKKAKPVFPYDYSSAINSNDLSMLKATPWGNTITKDLAMECIRSESLGKDEFPDMLCISFSSPDIIGHSYGPRAVEMEDVYLRLDKEIEDLLNYLDLEVGKENYTVFLTADHGVAENANYLKDQKIPAGYINRKKIEKELKGFCFKQFGDSLIRNVSNEQVFLNQEKISELKLNLNEVEQSLANKLVTIDGIGDAYPSQIMKNYPAQGADFKSLLANGYNQKRSGNVVFTFLPGWMDHEEKGTTHGAVYSYDTHVPLIFFGNGINKSSNLIYTPITEIAPTICTLLNIPFPNGCVAQPIRNALIK